MAYLKLNLAVVTTIVVAYMRFSLVASGSSYVVGGPQGWIAPPNPDYYEAWKKEKKFIEGDTFWFNFEPNQHTIRTVETQDAYETCNATDSGLISDEHRMGVTVWTANVYYYICTLHCEKGQKVIIDVKRSKKDW